MAWSNSGSRINLGAGATAYWWYVFDGAADVGMQIAEAHTRAAPGEPWGVAISFDQGREQQGSNQVVYRVSVRNAGDGFWVDHNLRGGGVS